MKEVLVGKNRKKKGRDFESEVSHRARRVSRVMVARKMTTAHVPLGTNHGEGLILVTVDPVVAEVVKRAIVETQKVVDEMVAVTTSELESMSSVTKAALTSKIGE